MTNPAQPDARPPRVGGCSETWSEKLFWYVNETLEAGETSLVEAHLAECPECREEVAELRLIKEAVHERASQAPEPSEAVYHRIMERIEAYESSSVRPSRIIQKLKSWLPSPELLWQPALRPVAVVAGLLILVQAVAIAGLLTFGGPPQAGPGYKTAAVPPLAEAQGPLAKIIFKPDATEQSIRGLLRDADASIVSGPSALGVYTIALPSSLKDEAAVEGAVGRLRARDDVVQFAERLP